MQIDNLQDKVTETEAQLAQQQHDYLIKIQELETRLQEEETT